MKLRTLWRRRRQQDDETRAEFEAHLELLVDRYVRQGMTPDEARGHALKQFGNVTWHREEIHLMNRVRWFDGIVQDLRYAIRQIRRSPGFSFVVVATLALGIGGTTAVFSVTHAVLLAPLPYAEPGQLVRLYQQEPDKPGTRRGFSAPQFRMLRDEAATSSACRRALLSRRSPGSTSAAAARSGCASSSSPATTSPRSARRRFAVQASADDEERCGATNRAGASRVVLSDALWRARFDADPAAIGRTARLSGEPYEIAGVAPADFEDPIAGVVDAWLPYDLQEHRDTISLNSSSAGCARRQPRGGCGRAGRLQSVARPALAGGEGEQSRRGAAPRGCHPRLARWCSFCSLPSAWCCSSPR